MPKGTQRLHGPLASLEVRGSKEFQFRHSVTHPDKLVIEPRVGGLQHSNERCNGVGPNPAKRRHVFEIGLTICFVEVRLEHPGAEQPPTDHRFTAFGTTEAKQKAREYEQKAEKNRSAFAHVTSLSKPDVQSKSPVSAQVDCSL